MMKRRALLKMGGGSLALAGLGLAAPATAATPQDGVTAAAQNGYRWSQAGAQALVGQQFWLNHPEGGAIGLRLEAVTAAATDTAAQAGTAAGPAPAAPVPQPPVPQPPLLQQFTLLFEGPAGTGFAAGSYEMDHAAIGRFALYLAPAGKRTGANLYRAEFSLLA